MDDAGGPPVKKKSVPIQDPNPDRIRHLADLFYRFASNKVSLTDIARLPGKHIRRLVEVAHLKFKHGRLDEAFEIFSLLARVDHKNYYYRTALGGIYQKRKKWVEALANYSMALALNPKDVASCVNRGEIFLRHDKFKKAAQDFRQSILMDRAGKNLWANRARSLVIALKRTIELRKAEQAELAVPATPRSTAPRVAARQPTRPAQRVVRKKK